ncbi:MAG: TlpA family protein disulfide reductase [Campylobacter sp.]|nr:TlpA family protein disulfide reductase [Campylobacter sp.]
MRKILLTVFIIFTFSACVKEYDKHHITLNDPNGIDTQFFPKEQRLKIGDKPYVLFFFSPECGVCKEQIPDINEIYASYGDKINVVGVFGPSIGFDKDIEILNAHKVKFKTTSDKISVDYFSKAVGGVMGVPVTYIYDKDGKLQDKFIGMTPRKVLLDSLKLVL